MGDNAPSSQSASVDGGTGIMFLFCFFPLLPLSATLWGGMGEFLCCCGVFFLLLSFSTPKLQSLNPSRIKGLH